MNLRQHKHRLPCFISPLALKMYIFLKSGQKKEDSTVFLYSQEGTYYTYFTLHNWCEEQSAGQLARNITSGLCDKLLISMCAPHGSQYYRLLFLCSILVTVQPHLLGPELQRHSHWSRSRCRVFAAPRAGPGPPVCQTHYCRWSWRWPCLPDLRQGEQHCQGLNTVADKSFRTGNTTLLLASM